MLNDSIIIEWEGKELRTTQNPYINDEGNLYSASAADADNNGYIITWEVIDFETTDESSACNWNNPIGITLVK
ncbi:hypothetical protein BK126_04520 [Paenibacillus sp. FSL H7-0326]|uniref:hypothetical protein n=1 Tax=Paenibacillus sp. FSL H7-0326 TaxID=1921144 RepID=UPI00096E91F2|nr:hypothetical protein [Paenibacillus sp. FSL H7-0326]OMC71367.1 hypothetical protein BK126_04520 [Paenibacillus sp. FSL H7-0326]